MTSIKKHNGLGVAGILGALVALGGVVACGDDFSGDDCKANRTCTTTGGDPSGQAGDGPADAAGGDQGGKANGGGSPGDAGSSQAGSEGMALCTSAAQCDNGDPQDGKEICGDDGVCGAGNPPPTVVAVSPEGEAEAVEPDTQVVITFSEPLDPATVTRQSIRVLDGETAVDGELGYANGKVTFTASAPLALLAEYAISVGTAVTDVDGAALLEEYSSHFVTRDGAWHTTSIPDGDLYQLADTVPITATGNVLVAWINIDSPGHYCPTSAVWYNRGEALSEPARLTANDIQDCRSVTAGSNAAGVASVLWQEDKEYAEQYRDGDWSISKSTVSSSGLTMRFAVGVSPEGAVSVFQQSSGGTTVRATDADGVWQGAARNIAAGKNGVSPAHIAFDSKGNGFALWRAEATGIDQILYAQYTSADGWTDARALPGSVAHDSDTNVERGVPAIAMDEDGGAMAVWVKEGGNQSPFVASRYTSANGWSSPAIVAPSVGAESLTHAPGLVFDGHEYVTAWTGDNGQGDAVVTSRYDLELETWREYEQHSEGDVLERMPQLAVDSHQNLLLTWVVGHASGGQLFWARYDARAGAWSDVQPLPNGIVKDTKVETVAATPLSAAANGLGAQLWGDRNGSDQLALIRLSSFY